jgi:hypothetical protein
MNLELATRWIPKNVEFLRVHPKAGAKVESIGQINYITLK